MLSIHYTGDVESVVLQRMSALSRNQASELWIKPVPEPKYLNADNVARYRLIMRLFYENHSKMKYWLKTEDVFADVMAWGLLADYTEELCQRDLEVLTDNLHGESSVDVDLKRLDEALRRTRFDVSLEDCMHVLYPGEFISRRRQRETEVAAWDTFCAWAGARTSNPPLTVWWQALAGGSGPGYRAFRECWQEFLQRGDSLGWTAAIAALEALLRRPGGAVAVFAFRCLRRRRPGTRMGWIGRGWRGACSSGAWLRCGRWRMGQAMLVQKRRGTAMMLRRGTLPARSWTAMLSARCMPDLDWCWTTSVPSCGLPVSRRSRSTRLP